jgi:hypothetical protein
MDESLAVVATPQDAISVELVGKKYMLKPPKSALALKVGVKAKQASEDPSQMLEALDEWLTAAVGAKNVAAIHKRLDDPNDLLDYQHITQLMNLVLERSSKVPPTSPSDSSR